ncbi:MAG: thioesterase domain-containing protein [Candidatus Acidiferrales bacterium]
MRQLLQQGHEVALLTMLDTRNPAYFRHNSNGHRRGALRKWRRVLHHLQELRQLNSAEAYGYMADRMKALWRTVRRDAWELSTEVRARRNAGRLTDFERIFSLALKNYNPEPYPGRVALFRADTKSDEALSGWRDVITGPEQAHVVPGTHLGMLADPSVQHLASRLAACIDEASDLVTRSNRSPEELLGEVVRERESSNAYSHVNAFSESLRIT